MARRRTPAQIKSKIRQAQSKRKQAIARYNQAIRRHNQQVRQSVNQYSRQVRAHSGRVRANRQRIQNELARLARRAHTTRYMTYRASVHDLHRSYVRLEQHTETKSLGPAHDRLLDLSEREVANSLSVANATSGADDGETPTPDGLLDIVLTDELRQLSEDLDARWQGAVYSLNPRNPDAARHFCTSAREVVTQILELGAPDDDVAAHMPDCERTDQGKPTRRAKISYCLHRHSVLDANLTEFVEKDVDNIVTLFRVFNDGTHGSAGRFDLRQLNAVKKRVEDGILFLTALVA